MWLLLVTTVMIYGCWTGFSLILLFVLPLEKVGRDVLQKALTHNGILANVVPEKFYIDCVAASIENLRSVQGGKWIKRIAFAKDLKLTASMLDLWLRDPSSAEWQCPNKYTEFFEHYFDHAK
jgi:hypothetical protein